MHAGPNSTLELSRLPPVTLLDDSQAEDLDLPARGREIADLARRLRAGFRTGDRVGVLYGTEPRLLLTWLATLHAGLEPLIIQYPNAKQNLGAWRSAIHDTFARAALAGIVCAPELERFGLETCRPLFLTQEVATGAQGALPPIPMDAAILQMSSGTTGHRKPLRLTLDQIATHVRDYNETMRLGADDSVVSWLPLYHDMGFIACFLMPLMLGVPVVMMDPMRWVVQPRRLFEAIDRYKATTCYMPNFGFEVMAKHSLGGSFPSMRRWISCSEAVDPATLERFAAATATPCDRLSACYAMAENVFAVTQRDGLKVVEVDGRAAASCGRPIANVDLKIVDGEIWVRSPASLIAYVDSLPVTDREGFYPTGDLGRLIDDELVVIGRKHDLVNIGGKKFLLSNLDQDLARVLPTPDGRAAALARREPALATELPLFLIEDRDFYLRSDLGTIRARLAQEIDMESFAVDFVPPGFLTKTSSGKFNRPATLANYEAALQWGASFRDNVAEGSVEDEILRLFGTMPLDLPVESFLDSLGLATLDALLRDVDLRLDPGLSLRAYLDSLRARECVSAGSRQRASREHIAIVSLADGRAMSGISKGDLERLSERAGAPVTLEHVCLPPTPVILSDLVFFDYFLPRTHSESYRAVVSTLSKVRSASMLIVDDVAEFLFGNVAYPALNHRLERSPAADLLVWRWQRYARYHDQLPISVVNLWQTQALRNAFIDRLGRYLGVPIFRMATLHSYAEFTAGWEFVDRTNADWTMTLDINTANLVTRLAAYVQDRRAEMRRCLGPIDLRPRITDLPHFCSIYIDRAKVEEVLQNFGRFCLVGIKSAAPFIRRRLRELGKPYIETSNRNLKAQGYSDRDFDCVLQVGSWGRVQTAKPVFQIFSAGWDPTLQPATLGGLPITDPSWFYADLSSAPNELSGKRRLLWLLGEPRVSGSTGASS